jgi:hypothetical protein
VVLRARFNWDAAMTFGAIVSFAWPERSLIAVLTTKGFGTIPQRELGSPIVDYQSWMCLRKAINRCSPQTDDM